MGISKRQRDHYWPLIIDRDGHDLCSRCGDPGKIIHHINGDDTENNLTNLLILCLGCNKLKKLQKKYLPVSTIHYQISASHKKNLLAEPRFRRWLLGVCMSNNGHYPTHLVIKQGAFECKISIDTVRRYLEKLTDHPSSPYLEFDGNIFLRENAPQEELE